MTTPITQTSTQRIERLEARITLQQKNLFKQAADLQGRSLSDFIVQAAAEAAQRVVEQHHLIKLSAGEQTALVEALLNPPKPNSKLRAAARKHRKTMGK